MTLTNHLLTGAALAKVLPLPIAIPLAFISHFVLDSLPHFGLKDMGSIENRRKHKKLLVSVVSIDVILGILFIAWLIESNHIKWLIVALVAYSPDLIWIYRFTVEEKFGRLAQTKGNRFIQFHVGIQKYERIWGLFVEVVYGSLLFLAIH